MLAAEVEPYEAVPSQSVDARQAWDAANEVAMAVLPQTANALKIPNGWSTCVGNLQSICAIPMAIGCFPQAVRDLLPLIRANQLSDTIAPIRPMSEDPALASCVDSASRSDEPGQCLLAASILRLSGRIADARRMLAEKRDQFSSPWITALSNEEAALAWFCGDTAAAKAKWNAMPESEVRSFNLGIAELFSNRPEAAQPHLKDAIARLDESSAWHHLARLYLALAEGR